MRKTDAEGYRSWQGDVLVTLRLSNGGGTVLTEDQAQELVARVQHAIIEGNAAPLPKKDS